MAEEGLAAAIAETQRILQPLISRPALKDKVRDAQRRIRGVRSMDCAKTRQTLPPPPTQRHRPRMHGDAQPRKPAIVRARATHGNWRAAFRRTDICWTPHPCVRDVIDRCADARLLPGGPGLWGARAPFPPRQLLSKPPFRFLHDVFSAVINENGFAKGLYTDEEMDSGNLKDKGAKLAYLDKVRVRARRNKTSTILYRATRFFCQFTDTRH